MKPIHPCAVWWIVAGAILTGFHTVLGEEAPDPNAVAARSFVKDGRLDLPAAVKYFEDLYRSESSISRARLEVIRPRLTRGLTMKIWTLGQERALVVIEEPARERGTATLKVEENLWNYLPKIRRTIRIPPSMMLASWMGSDFTNDDLVREASYTEDYTYELIGASEDPAGWLIRFTAKPDVVGLWSRFDLVVNKEGTIPLVGRYYDRRGELARVLTWDRVRLFDGRRVPSRMTLVPLDKEGHKTVMTYLEIAFDVPVPEQMFSLSELERRR